MVQLANTPLKVWMCKRDISNKELAGMLGIKPSTVSNYVTGRNLPSWETRLDIAEILGVHVDRLFPKKTG